MRSRPFISASFLIFAAACQHTAAVTKASALSAAPVFQVRVGTQLTSEPASDGRMLLVISSRGSKEPRELVSDRDDTAQLFGVDVQGARAGTVVRFEGDVLGSPLPSLSQLPPGDYFVQAVFNRYVTFHRADGHTLSLPPDRGEGQQWSMKPGNWVSTPQLVHVGPGEPTHVALELDHALPPLPERPDTRYVKHIRIRSEKLSAFWGQPMELGAIVVLPYGWDTHPDAHYPVIINHSHFGRKMESFREEAVDTTLPEPNLAGLRAQCQNGHEAGCGKNGYARYAQEQEHAFFLKWTGPNFQRVLLVQIEHATPFYDDSYAVNSANQGPWGDAIVEELLPAIEKKFRGLGPWARGMYGGSTGGWEAIADQIFYPDQFNGAVANCPDPVDFHAYELVDLYSDSNAYYSEGPFRRTPTPASRGVYGRSTSTVEQENHQELVIGTQSRSGGQWDVWEATYSPVGEDGYPRRVWDKTTGVLDLETVAYWKEHYDLTHILERDWATLGPKLQGKLHVNVGRDDTYFLDGAVHHLDEFLRTTHAPISDAQIDYGVGDGHCWSGDHEHPNWQSRLTYHARFIPLLVRHFLDSAPAGADTKSWRY